MTMTPSQDHALELSLGESIRSVGREQWESLRLDSTSGSAHNPFLRFDFLSALESTSCVGDESGWLPRPLILRDDGRVVGLAPLYVKGHSQGEYVFDHAWADALERAGGSYYPKLQLSIPFTPATGPRLMLAQDAPLTRTDMARALAGLPGALGLSSCHATFLTEEDRAAFEQAGYLMRTDRQFHFFNRGYADFEDFLTALNARKRKLIRRERREAFEAGITVRHLTGRELTEAVWDDFFAFYQDTGSRKWGMPYLTRAFFSAIGETMADAILLIVAERNGRRIAGALNFIGSDTLYGRYWGAIEHHPFLHFELCYHQAIDYALAHGLKRVEAGAQGEHKLARGFEPVTTWSAHWIEHQGLRQAVARHLAVERAHIAAEVERLGLEAPFRKA